MREPGIYADIPIDEYHASEGISSSGVSLILDCPARYYQRYMSPEGKGESDTASTFLGRAVHMLVLEPDLFNETYYTMKEPVNLRTKSGREAYEEAIARASGREVLRAGTWEVAVAMSQSILKSAMWNKIIPGHSEHSIFWDAGVYNTRLRTRPDFYNDRMIIDIKTTDSIKSFSRSVYTYGYHRQAAMQIDGLRQFDGKDRFFGFMVVENKAPYLTACFVLNEESVTQGRRDYLDAAALYSECIESGVWPGYEDQFQEISIPEWAMMQREY